MNKKISDKEKNTRESKSPRGKQIAQLMAPVLFYLLKEYSSPSNPLSAADIASFYDELTHEDDSNSETIKAKLDLIISLQQDPSIGNSLRLTFGGCIESLAVSRESFHSNKKTHLKYYFKPLLDNSDLSMICASIASNRYLTAEEKEYLIFREKALGTGQLNLVKSSKNYRKTINTQDLPKKPAKKDLHLPPFAKTTSNYLETVNILYSAVQQGHKLRVIYGRYHQITQTEKKSALKFVPTNENKPYRLNPYALLWNNGDFYLLATHAGHTNPVHFRIDRIYDVALLEELDEETSTSHFVARDPIPDSLKQFFDTTNLHSAPVFDAQAYTAMHPYMSIYKEPHQLITCCIECTTHSLPLLIDHFGNRFTIKPSPVSHSKEETVDINNRPIDFLMATITNVEYDSMKLFAELQASNFTVLYPPQLVDDIKASLASSQKKYTSIPELSEELLFS